MSKEKPKKDSRESLKRGARLDLLDEFFQINKKILNYILSKGDIDKGTAYDYHDEMSDAIKVKIINVKRQLDQTE